MQMRSRTVLFGLALGIVGISLGLTARTGDGAEGPGRWWAPDEDRILPAVLDHDNAWGTLRTVLVGGPMRTKGHAFFTSLGPNGRACITCHQPADGMSISVSTIQERWAATDGQDPLFAAYDGANCPDLPQDKPESHSLLLEHGLFRIQRPWPPRKADGTAIEPDFEIEAVRDPAGCNTGEKWGLDAENPRISVYRRPRPAANLKYLLAKGFAYDPKAGMPLPVDPVTGEPRSGNLMADRRVLTLDAQARDAARTHLERHGAVREEDLAEIIDFESRIFSAQQRDVNGRPINEGGAYGGPQYLADSKPGQLGSQGVSVWSEFAAWEDIPENADLSEKERAFRESVARGARVFREKMFLISDSMGINWPIGFGNPVRNSCVFCHNMRQMGNDVAPGQVDLGTTVRPFSDPAPHLPLFRITCKDDPHPFYGREFYTTDPGYALTSGRCMDVGRITLQSMRGLAGRAPYFSNGSADTLREIVDYYDRRYNIGYSEREKQDLVNLMSVL